MGESLLKRTIEAMRGTKFVQTKMGDFFFGVLTELDTVTWPTKNEVYNSTVVVLIAVTFFSLYSALWEVIMSMAKNVIFS